MASVQFTLRAAAKDDIKKVFELSNEDEVRRNSINKNKISWNDHVKWFNNRLKRGGFYIAETPEGGFIGQARIENKNGEKEISLSITEEYRGKGLAAEIIRAAAEKSGADKITAYIYDYNTASIRAFEKAGFKNTHLLQYTFDKDSLK